jgi:Ca2+-transporting ATPase
MKAYTSDVKDVIKNLETNSHEGLTHEEVKKRIEKYGKNKLKEKKQKTTLEIFLRQFMEPLSIILLVVVVVAFLIRDTSEAIIILSIVILNSIVATMQEVKAKKSLDALKSMSSIRTIVIRGGELVELESEELVPGDVVIIEAGKFVPADVRLIEAHNLMVNEAVLTGESLAVEKNTDKVIEENNKEIIIAERTNMLYMSTLITNGRAKAVVTGTAEETEIGKIAKFIQDEEEGTTPLQKKLAVLSKQITKVAALVAVVMLLIEVFSLKQEFLKALITSLTIAVAIIPESLPIIVSMVLALGIQKMSKKNAIVKKLPAVESLGSVNVICSDKTGTLTQNKMKVTDYYFDEKSGKVETLEIDESNQYMLELLMKGFVLCNDAISQEGNVIGDPTEIALIEFPKKFSYDELEIRSENKRLSEIPFDSDRKLMSTVNQYKGKKIAFTKGAVDQLLERATKILKNDVIIDITPEDKANIINNMTLMSEKALRVLSLGFKMLPENSDYTLETLETEIIYVGMVGMIDPPRIEVRDSVLRAKSAGIDVKMITGDHKITAFEIAKQLGIANEIEQSIEGVELNDMSDDELKKRVQNIKVFARVSPEHKVRIVKALQDTGNTVSMTGDGVNDAPSLKAADIGVAMGITGTDVSKETADMILVDDNFTTIVNAVDEGRNIYEKIKKAILFILATNLGEVSAILGTVLLGMKEPLAAMHVLWVNLMVESLIAIPFSMAKNDDSLMENKPRAKNESIFNNMILRLLLSATYVGLTVFGVYLFITKTTGNHILATTAAFIVMANSPAIYALSINSSKLFYEKDFFENKILNAAIGIALILNAMLVLIPDLAKFFKLETMSILGYTQYLLLALIPFVLMEITKFIIMKYKK